MIYPYPMACFILIGLNLLPLYAAKAPNTQSLLDKPIQIEADRVELDEQKGISVYKGNIRIVQGEIEMRAHTLTVHIVKGRISQLVAEGKPVDLVRSGETPMKAQADTMKYFASKGSISILGGAHLWQGLNEFSGDQIEYDIESDRMTAAKANHQSKRVKVILYPQKKNNPP